MSFADIQKDLFGGRTISLTQKECQMSPELFALTLQNVTQELQAARVRALWLKLPFAAAKFLPLAVDQGFSSHHALPAYFMLIKWLPGGPVPSSIPHYAHHQIGVAGMVLDGKGNVLGIQEASGVTAGRKDFWKLPGGLVDPKESIRQAVEREVFEETGLRVSFVSLVAFRESLTGPFGLTDFYCICACRLLPNQPEPSPRQGEIAAAKWLPLTQFLGSPYYQKGLYGSLLKSSAASAKVALGLDPERPKEAAGLSEFQLPTMGGKVESLFCVSKL